MRVYRGPVTILLLVDHDPRFTSVQDAFVARHPSTITITPEPGDGAIATRTCAAITNANPMPPLVIAATGRAALTLPTVARSQAALHRRVTEYVLLEPELPTVSDVWPDARVTVVCGVDSEASLQARLRGWDVLDIADVAAWSPAE